MMKKDSVSRVSGTRIALATVLVSLLLCSVAGQVLAAAGARASGQVDRGLIVPNCRPLTCTVADWDENSAVEYWDIGAYAADFHKDDPRTDLNCDKTIDSDDFYDFVFLHSGCD